MASLAVRLAALEKRAIAQGKVKRPARQTPLPDGMVEIDGLLWYAMPDDEWAAVQAIITEAEALTAGGVVQGDDVDWQPAYMPEPAPERDQHGGPVLDVTTPAQLRRDGWIVGDWINAERNRARRKH